MAEVIKDPGTQEWYQDIQKQMRDWKFTLKEHYDQVTEHGGVHIFVYELAEDHPEIRKDRLETLLTQDDDSQPQAQWRFYLDTLWHFVPYFI